MNSGWAITEAVSQSMWDLWWTKWYWNRFFPEYFRHPLSVSFQRCSMTWKNRKKLIIFITWLHNKPQGCGASLASASGAVHHKKEKKNPMKSKFHVNGPSVISETHYTFRIQRPLRLTFVRNANVTKKLLYNSSLWIRHRVWKCFKVRPGFITHLYATSTALWLFSDF
jgi:hypothetical protein